jgi:hypothetical protein
MITALINAHFTARGESSAWRERPSASTPQLTPTTPAQASGLSRSPSVALAESATSSGAVPRISG